MDIIEYLNNKCNDSNLGQTGSRYFGNHTEYSDYDYIVFCRPNNDHDWITIQEHRIPSLFYKIVIDIAVQDKTTLSGHWRVEIYTPDTIYDRENREIVKSFIYRTNNGSEYCFNLLGSDYEGATFYVYDFTYDGKNIQFMLYQSRTLFDDTVEARDYVKKYLHKLGDDYKFAYGLLQAFLPMYRNMMRKEGGIVAENTFEDVLQRISESVNYPKSVVINGVEYRRKF